MGHRQIYSNCTNCIMYSRNNTKEPLLQPEPEIVVDYFSIFGYKTEENCTAVERHLMATFAVHGLLQHIVANNRAFNREHFQTFCEKHSIKLTTTKLTVSQAYGQVERYTRIFKTLLRKAHENGQAESIALLEYRITPFTGCDYSPAQMLTR
ncbi:hypothetical protein MAR_007860 [Mya arenaria]|uniref:Integrase catalytic domain-containing protein n=1 Tax=Mya arenaria TaxID=6604 RepID=A0ABY7DXG3_MYAAR|nr:hypothetical protein MAR_007860 [Mya arenaria]